MKANKAIKKAFSKESKMSKGGVVIMIGKPSKGKGKMAEDDDDKCEACGKKGCKMKCGGKAKMQDGGKTKSKTAGGSLGTIYTGPAKTSPGVLKAQADKRKSDAAVAAYAAKKKKK